MLLQHLRDSQGRLALLAHTQAQRLHSSVQQEAGVRVQAAPKHHHLLFHLRPSSEAEEAEGLLRQYDSSTKSRTKSLPEQQLSYALSLQSAMHDQHGQGAH